MKTRPGERRTLGDLFPYVLVRADDRPKPDEERFGPPAQPTQVASYGELFTTAPVGEMQARAFESVWHTLPEQHWACPFPRLPDYGRYHRTLRKAERLFAELAPGVAGGDGGPLTPPPDVNSP